VGNVDYGPDPSGPRAWAVVPGDRAVHRV